MYEWALSDVVHDVLMEHCCVLQGIVISVCVMIGVLRWWAHRHTMEIIRIE